MKLSNLRGYPQAIVDAVKADTYNKGDSDFSVTELLKPARQRALQIRYYDMLEEDVESRLWALYGQITHLILERSNRKDLAEERFFMTVGKYKISGQIDSLCIEDEILTDYKFTTSWGFMANQPPKPEWIAQLNMQLEILRHNGHDAKSLQIVGLLRDHQKSKAKESPNYPQTPIARHEIPMWPRNITLAFIKKRIEAHIAAEKMNPDCSDEERWAKPEMWAVMKPSQKRAVKLFTSAQEARDLAATIQGARVQVRKGVSARCEDYCNVNKYCIQYQSEIKNQKGVIHGATEKTGIEQSSTSSALSENE